MSYKVVLLPGDGIGPEVTAAAVEVLEATGVGFEWIELEAGAAVLEREGTPLPQRVINQIKEIGLALKGPITTPVGTGFRSVNVTLRQELDLYANVRPARNLPGVPSRYTGVDIVIFRENTEDLYAGVEHRVGKDAAESIKIITREASIRICEAAFSFARREGRRKVTAVHKANIMKLSDGLFLECARQVAAQYPEIEFEDVIVDAACMKLVQAPEQFDVMVMPNLYGDIVSDLCAGLVGGLGVAPGANLGVKAAVFEAVHGSAPQIAGQNLANPLALILSGAMLLGHLGEVEAAQSVRTAVARVLQEGIKTPDLGGRAGTREVGRAIAEALKK
ncbi:MAG: isocitrate/isopropylmalate dehydrogenase family protein [Bacillota bacterium]